METAFGWFSSIMESLGHLIPRLKHVESNQLGVLFKRNKAIPLGPGMHWYWPVWSRPMIQCAARSTYTCESQHISTSDHKTVCVRAQVIIEISDAMLSFVRTSSINEVVVDMALNGVRSVITRTTLEDLIKRPRAVDAAITRRIRAELKEYGVSVVRAFLSDCTPAIVLCLVKE